MAIHGTIRHTWYYSAGISNGSGTTVSMRLPVVAGAVESHAESAPVAVAA